MICLRLVYRRLLRWGFRLLYNEMAWSYDIVSWAVSLGHWRTWQRASLPYLRGSRVLEVAFGTGNLLLDLQAAGFATYGVDISPYMVAITRRKLRQAGCSALLCRAAVRDLPFAEGTFDSLVATFPTSFVHEMKALTEMARVLRPGGRLVIVDRAYLTRPTWLARFIESLYQATGQRPAWGLSLAQWLRELGWRASERFEVLERSTVCLVLADRPACSSPELSFGV